MIYRRDKTKNETVWTKHHIQPTDHVEATRLYIYLKNSFPAFDWKLITVLTSEIPKTDKKDG